MNEPRRPVGLLQRLAHWIRGHYRAVFVAFAVLLVVALGLASRLRFDTDVLNLLPRKDPVINAYMDTLKDFGTFDYLMITVRLPEGATVAPYEIFVDRLGARLEKVEQISGVDYRIGDPIELVESFFPFALLFLDDAGRAELATRLSDEGIQRRAQDLKRLLSTPQAMVMKDLVKVDPFGIAEIFTGGLTAGRGGLAVDWSSGYFLSKDRQVLLLLVKPTEPPQNIAFDRELGAATQAAIDATLAEWEEIAGPNGPPPPTARAGGPYVTALIDASAIQQDMTVNMISSMALVLLLFLFAFRRFGPLVYAFVPLAAGLVLTFGFSAAVFGTLSSATSGTAALLIGLGIDFIIVSYGRFVEERNRGADFDVALANMMGTCGRAVVVGAVTTAATFYAFTFTDFRGLRQMGILTGSGILFCVIAVLFLLPAMLAWSEDHSKRRRKAPRLYLHSFGSERLVAACMRHPRAVLAIGLGITVAAGLLLPRLSFEDSWRSMRPAGNEGVEVEQEVAKSFDSDFDFMMLVLEGPELGPLLERTAEATKRAQELVADGVMNGVSSVTSFVPPPSAQREALAWLAAGRADGTFDVERIRRTFGAALLAENRRVEPFDHGLDLLAQGLDANAPVGVEDFAGNSQVRRLLDRALLRKADGWKSVIYLYPPAEIYRRQAPEAAIGLADSLGPHVTLTGANLVNERMRDRVRRDAWLAALLGTLVVAMLLWLDFRSLRAAILALVPLAVGIVWMLAGMVLLDISMNFMNIFVTTMIIGIGVDYGLHMVHRYFEVRGTSRERVLEGLQQTGNAIVVAALSTMVGFGSMSLSHYPGLRSTGYAAILGAATTAIIAVTMLPAYLSLRVDARSRRVTLLGVGSLLALLLLGPTPVSAQESALVGHWEGAYGRLGSIQTVMLDFVVRNGQLDGTYDVPDLGIFGEPIKTVEGTYPDLSIGITYGQFSLHVSPEIEEITGENKKWNPPLTLHLKRREKRPAIRLPREAVRFTNGEVSLAGTLVLPASGGPHPAIIIVHGSGEQGLEDGFYAQWGDFFAERGLAALIYDKRGVGGSSGNFNRATFDDLAGDVLAAVETLKARPDIEPDQIGLFGISQGGWLAPLAASRTGAVKYLILYVGPAVTVQEQELDRVEYSLRADEFSEEDVEEALEYTRQVFAAAYAGVGTEQLVARSEEVKGEAWSEYLDLVSSDEELEGWRLIRFDPAPVLKKTKLPLLAIFGELDVLVPPKENLDPMRGYLSEAGNGDFTIRVIPGVGHEMETFGTLKGGEWSWPEKYWVWPRKSPEVYRVIETWLSEHGLARPRRSDLARPQSGG